MNAKTRRRLEMGKRALEFSRAHPDASPGYAAALTRLEQSVARADQLAVQHRDGINEVRTATAQKERLRRMMRRAHLRHLATVAKIAGQEVPDLPQKFTLPPGTLPYLTFRTVAGSMVAEATSRKELLEKHGLAAAVLDALDKSLQEFDEAMERGAEGRAAHVAARVKLNAIANEVVQIVQVMGAFNRFRFADDPDLLAAWESASNVIEPARRGNGHGTTPGATAASSGSTDAVKPAA